MIVTSYQVAKQYLSQSVAGVAPGTTGNFQFVVPTGYGKLKQVIFDPAKDVALTLTSQKAQQNILQNFSTLIGTAIGVIDLDSPAIKNDILILAYNVTAGAGLLTLTLVFEQTHE